jgi:hypothetical protein
LFDDRAASAGTRGVNRSQARRKIVMGDKGKKDKGGREQQKKPLLSPKEKRKLKQEKKNKK